MKNLIKWFDIPSSDFDRAVEFYKNILDVDIKIIDCGKEKMGCFPVDDLGISGSITWAENFKPSADGVLLSFDGGENLNDVLEKVKNNGGKVITKKTKIEAEGRGYFAVFTDSEGNSIGLYSDN